MIVAVPQNQAQRQTPVTDFALTFVPQTDFYRAYPEIKFLENGDIECIEADSEEEEEEEGDKDEDEGSDIDAQTISK